MIEADRVALIGWIWFIAWTVAGHAVGHWIGDPGTGMVTGFLFALVTLPVWPWIIPPQVDDWMHDLPAAQRKPHFWSRPEGEIGSGDRDMKRVAVVALAWFAFWMTAASLLGWAFSNPKMHAEAAYFGFFNGAWWALLTSFAWPWIMPSAIDRWMYKSELG